MPKIWEIGVAISTVMDFEIASSLSSDFTKIENVKGGVHSIQYHFTDLFLMPGIYKIGIGIRSKGVFEDYLPSIAEFEVLASEQAFEQRSSTRKGIIIPRIKIKI